MNAGVMGMIVLVVVSCALALLATIAVRLVLRPPPQALPAAADAAAARARAPAFRAVTPSPSATTEAARVAELEQWAHSVRRPAVRHLPDEPEVARGVPCWICGRDAAVGDHDHRRAP